MAALCALNRSAEPMGLSSNKGSSWGSCQVFDGRGAELLGLEEVGDLEQSKFDAPRYSLNSIADAQFGVNVVAVGFDATDGDGQLLCDLLIGEARRQKLQELPFSRCERLDEWLYGGLCNTAGRSVCILLRS